MYYRIFILFPNSKYVFTKSKRPTLETIEQPLEVSKSAAKDKSNIVIHPNQSTKPEAKKPEDSLKKACN